LNKHTTIYCLLIALLSIPIVGCKDNIQSSIPDYPVYLQLNLTAQYPTFKYNPLQFLTFVKGISTDITANESTGFGGIVVCTGMTFDDYGNIEYYAFDMACPYEVKSAVKVHPNSESNLVCDKCGSVFDIKSGSGMPTSGPAKEFLKKYRTSLSGDVLYVNR
jgi:nitrite reductase/ring-hydroxylating ferredoxin subunit